MQTFLTRAGKMFANYFYLIHTVYRSISSMNNFSTSFSKCIQFYHQAMIIFVLLFFFLRHPLNLDLLHFNFV